METSGLELKEPKKTVLDEDYEGLLSSYIEPNSMNEAWFHRHIDPMTTKPPELDDNTETPQHCGKHRT